MIKSKVSPSMMCTNYFDLKNTIDIFEKNNIEYLHIDIMDGVFVPNIEMGANLVKQISEYSKIPLDYHFMVEKPENFLNYFKYIKSGDIVSIHFETTKHAQRVLSLIKEKGAKAFIALNPQTPISMIENLIDDIDGVLIMCVNPGFAGQKLIPSSIKKIKDLREYLDKNDKKNIEIEVDGNVSFINAELMRKNGANIFVGGTSSIFNGDIEASIQKLRDSIK